MSTAGDQPPRWLWRMGVWGLAGVVAATLVTLALALAGAFDPRPDGRLALDQAPAALDWRVWPGDAHGEAQGDTLTLSVPDPHTRAWAEVSPELRPPFTLEITARQVGGPREARYGLWLGETIGSEAVVIAINGNDYFGIFQDGQGREPVVAWQTFPHVRGQGDTNRLRVDVEGGQASVRINDEIAAAFEAPHYAGRFGFYVETFNTGGSLVAFERVQIWESP